jgi:hypothetical protein
MKLVRFLGIKSLFSLVILKLLKIIKKNSMTLIKGGSPKVYTIWKEEWLLVCKGTFASCNNHLVGTRCVVGPT